MTRATVPIDRTEVGAAHESDLRTVAPEGAVGCAALHTHHRRGTEAEVAGVAGVRHLDFVPPGYAGECPARDGRS